MRGIRPGAGLACAASSPPPAAMSISRRGARRPARSALERPAMKTAAQDQACRDRAARLPENIADRVAEHARRAPGAIALLEHNTGETVTWKQLDTAADAFAARLLAAGYRKGDVVATSLPLLKEHVFLLVACYRIGVILAPLDLRLRAPASGSATGASSSSPPARPARPSRRCSATRASSSRTSGSPSGSTSGRTTGCW